MARCGNVSRVEWPRKGDVSGARVWVGGLQGSPMAAAQAGTGPPPAAGETEDEVDRCAVRVRWGEGLVEGRMGERVVSRSSRVG